MIKRNEVLNGPTYSIKINDNDFIYLTINDQDGKPFEIFTRHNSNQNAADAFEWVTALTVLITRSLRAGESIVDIGKELEEIHGPNTSHMIPGTSEKSPSIVARIGRILIKHGEGK